MLTKRKPARKGGSAPAQDRATRVVYWACKNFDEAVKWSREWPGPAHGFEEREGAGSAEELIAKHPAHKADSIFRITTIVEAVTAERAGKDGTGT